MAAPYAVVHRKGLAVVVLLQVFAVLIVVFGVAIVLTHRAEGMSEEARDLADTGIPRDRPMTPHDVIGLRFALAFRGYRMGEVDDALDRLAAELAARDEIIARLRGDHEAVPSDATGEVPAGIAATVPRAPDAGAPDWHEPDFRERAEPAFGRWAEPVRTPGPPGPPGPAGPAGLGPAAGAGAAGGLGAGEAAAMPDTPLDEPTRWERAESAESPEGTAAGADAEADAVAALGEPAERPAVSPAVSPAVADAGPVVPPPVFRAPTYEPRPYEPPSSERRADEPPSSERRADEPEADERPVTVPPRATDETTAVLPAPADEDVARTDEPAAAGPGADLGAEPPTEDATEPATEPATEDGAERAPEPIFGSLPNPFRPAVPDISTYDPWSVPPATRDSDGPEYVEVEHPEDAEVPDDHTEHQTGYAPPVRSGETPREADAGDESGDEPGDESGNDRGAEPGGERGGERGGEPPELRPWS